MSMKHSTAEVAARLTRDEFPRSARYDPLWMLENLMGPNPLWLAESLSQIMDLEPDTRVMDLGCGKALTSIFLAEEINMLRSDAGRTLGFTRVVAHRKEAR